MDNKTKKFKPSIIFILGSLIFLVFVGYYFFYWVPRQKANLANRYLRVMTMMSDQFEKRGENFPKEIEITIDNQNPVMESNGTPKNPIIEGTRTYLLDNLKSFFPDTAPEPYLKPRENIPSQIFYDSLQDAFIFTLKVKPVIPGVKSESLSVNIPVKVVDFIRELSCGEEFDDVLILDDQSTVIYMRNQYMNKGIENNFRALNIKEMLNDRGSQPGENKNQEEGYTRLLDIKIAGSVYKFFLQPIPLRFLQLKPGSGNAKNWQIAGVLSANTFSRRSREIPINFLLLFIFLLSLAFIAYPMVKILLIGPWERIRIRDVCFLALSLAVGVPIIIFSILTISHYQAAKVNLEKDFKNLANNINKRFTNEIQSAYDQLFFIDREKEQLPLQKPGNANKKKPKQNFLNALLKKFGGISYYYFDMVFILDWNGNPCYKGVADESSISFKNVASREYFRRIVKKDYWYTRDNQPMVLDPVYSMSTVRYELNLAIPSVDSNYAAIVMSFRPLSVLNPLLPSDFGFAIINRDGKVIFHKDRRLNLNENFYSECSDAKRIKAAIFSKTQDFISSTLYQGKKRDIFIKPMLNIPWTIIVFRDRGFNDSKNLERLSQAILRYILYMLTLTALLLCYLVAIFLYKKASKIQRRPFAYKAGWIWPNKGLRFKYTCLAFFNLICFALVTISLFTAKTPYRPFLYIPLINLLLVYLVIRNAAMETSIKDKKNKTKKISFIVSAVALAAVIITFTLLATRYTGISPAVKILIIFIFVAVFSIMVLVPGEVKKIKNHLIYRNSHVLLVYSFVLLFFAHPPLMFDKISQDNDMIVDVKYHQLKLANDYSNWGKNIKRDYESHEQVIANNFCPSAHGVLASNWSIYSIKSYQTSIVTASIWNLWSIINFNTFPTYSFDKINFSSSKTPLINSTILGQICDIIPFDNAYSEAVRYFYMDPSDEAQPDYSLKWGYFKSRNLDKKEEKREIFLEYLDKPNLGYNEKGKKVEPVYIISRPQWCVNREVKLWMWGGIIVIALFIFLLFYIVHFTWKVIFLGSLGISPEKTAYIINSVDEIKRLQGRFFIFGNAPETITDGEENEDWLVIGCCKGEKLKAICENFPVEKKFIIITHFDYMRHNPQTNREKLALLEQAVYGCNATIIVYSQFEPLENFDLSESPVKNGDDKQEKANVHKYPTVIESWKRVLMQFEFKYALDEGIPGEIPEEDQIPIGLSKSSVAFIDSECSALEYIKPLKTHIFPDIETIIDKNIGDHVIRDIIFEHAIPVYDFIWRTSKKEEKLVLIQLAHEGLLNFKNREIIRQLLKRKLIKLSPLRLFNVTFNDYVVSADDMESILKWETTRGDSKWANVRKPLLFLLTGIIVFLVISQPNVLDTWLALIPAITGIIPLLLRLFDQLLGIGVRPE
jgi:hypothetical protein